MNSNLVYEIPSEEPEFFLATIKDNLRRCCREADFSRGVFFWAKQLENYCDLKYPLTTDDRIWFANLFYELMCIENMECSLIEQWCFACWRMLERPHLFDANTFVWDWKPLYQLLKQSFIPQQRQKVYPRQVRNMESIVKFIPIAKNYFSQSATEEIMSEFLPKINLELSTTSFPSAFAWLALFLPTNINEEFTKAQVESCLKNNEIGFKIHKDLLWTNAIFDLWGTFIPARCIDSSFLDLISDICYSQFGMNTFYLNEYQIRFTLTNFHRWLEFPIGSGLSVNDSGSISVGSKKILSSGQSVSGMKVMALDEACQKSPLLRKKKDRIKMMARLIVWNIFPATFYENKYHPYLKNDIMLSLLETWLQSLESFFHPSNSGRWSRHLIKLLELISQFLLNRIQWESLPTSYEKIGDNAVMGKGYSSAFNIDKQSIHRIIRLIKPLVLMSMFGKDSYTREYTQATIDNLIRIEPDLIYYNLLDSIYPSLNTLTETHRTTAAIGTLGAIAQSMINRKNFPKGASNLIDLMYQVLPGIDVNDPLKANFSFGFFVKVLANITLIDLSGTAEEKSEHEATLRISTSLLEEWVHFFLDKTFDLLEKIPQMRENTHESQVIQFALFSCNILAYQLSLPGTEKLTKSVLERIFRFMTDRVVHNAFGILSEFIHCFCSAFPKAMFEYLPILRNRIMEELNGNAGSDIYKGFRSQSNQKDWHDIYGTDAAIMWYLKCVLGYSSCIGLLTEDEALYRNYFSMLYELARDVWEKTRTRYVYKLAAKIIRSIIKSSGETWISEYRSIPHNWKTVDEIDRWGVNLSERLNVTNKEKDLIWKEIKANWHVPCEFEKSMIIPVINELTLQELQTIEKHLEDGEFGEGNAGSVKICKSITIISRILQAISSLVAPDYSDIDKNEENDLMEEDFGNEENDMMEYDDNDIEDSHDSNDSLLQRIPIKAYYCFENNDTRYQEMLSLKERIGQIVIRLSEHVFSVREDDIDSIKAILKIIRIFINNRGIEKQRFSEYNSSYSMIKSIFGTSINNIIPRNYSRYILLHRLYIQELRRKYHNSFLPLRQSEEEIALKLLQKCKMWSISRYAEIRGISQAVILKSLRFFKKFKYELVEDVLNILKQNCDKVLANQADGEKVSENLLSSVKGCLYLLSSGYMQNVCLRNYKYLSLSIVTLCRVSLVDKPSIQDLVTSVFLQWLGRYVQNSLVTLPSYKLLRIVSDLKDEEISQLQNGLEKSQAKKRDEKVNSIMTARKDLIDYADSNQTSHWHLSLIVCNFLEMLHRREVPISREASKYLIKCLVNDVLSVRKIAIGGICRILFLLKKRSIENIPHIKYYEFVEMESISDDIRILSSDGKRPKFYLDRFDYGWQFYSHPIKLYKTDGMDASLYTSDPSSQSAIDFLHETFCSNEFWTKFLGFVSIENSVSTRNNSTSEEQMSIQLIKFYKSVFQLYHDEFLYSCIEKIVSPWFSAYTEKALQRASLEFIIGLVRGMKHWKPVAIEKCWTWILPHMKNMMLNTTPDMINMWNSAFYWMTANRHPYRVWPIINLILNDPAFRFNPDSDAAFNESKKINFVRVILRNFGSRIIQFLPNIMNELMSPKAFSCRYQVVREAIGSLGWEIVMSHTLPAKAISVREYLEIVGKSDSPINSISKNWYQLNEQSETLLTRIIQELEKLQISVESNSKVYGSALSYHAKTFIRFFSDGLGCGRPYLITKCLFETGENKRSILANLFWMHTVADDKDLSETSSNLLFLLPDLPVAYVQGIEFPRKFLDCIYNEILNVCKDLDDEKRRRNILRSLAIIQVLFFRHLPEMGRREILNYVLDIICQFLQDSHVEIRQLSSITLSGLVRSCDTNTIEHLKEIFLQWLKTPVRRSSESSANEKFLLIPEGIIKRHAGILGISALVFAYPYTVPKWVPDLFLDISQYKSDPSPISNAVRHMFSEFRRTHQDTWSEVVGKTDYVDFYQFSVVEGKETKILERNDGVFTRRHLEALDGLLSNFSQYLW